MKEQAKQLREVARQALYSTPNDQECEIPIMTAVLRAIVNEFQYCDDYGNAFVNADDLEALANELENL